MFFPLLLVLLLIISIIFLFFLNGHIDDGIPGPRGIFLLGNYLDIRGSNRVAVLERWSHLFGPIYKFKVFSRTMFVVSDITAIHEILKARPNTFHRGSTVSMHSLNVILLIPIPVGSSFGRAERLRAVFR